MLDSTSSVALHRLQNAALIILSILMLPLDTFILAVSYWLGSHTGTNAVEQHRAISNTVHIQTRTILVTGVGMTKGLALARLFKQAGHTVIGADFEPNGSLVCGRVSRSLKVFYRLLKPTPESGAAPYVQGLLDVIKKEKVDLWVSCSGVASAVEDGEAKEIIEAETSCKAIQFNVKDTQILHEKHTFIERTASIGLTVPETHTITSRAAVEDILSNAPAGRKYIMKTIGVDDTVRADMTLLPKSSQTETSKHIARLKISEKTPWILQQFIRGPEFCTHSLVVKGQVKAFVACPSAELLMHYEALPAHSALSQAMLKFTKVYASKGGPDFTGHLSFDFMVEDNAINDPGKLVLYPIECNPRAHTAVALFNRTPELAGAYLSVFNSEPQEDPVVYPNQPASYYWVGHDFVELVVVPTISFLMLQSPFFHLLRNYVTFLQHLLFWKDGTYEVWDPLPWWWLYHIYWPMQFASRILSGKKWSRINVSTTKMFDC